MEKSRQEPQSVYGDSERHGRPLDAAFEHQKFYGLHKRRPS